MTYGYYPGCSLEGISVEYDISIRRLFAALEVDFKEIPGWICCGTLAAPSLSRILGLATPLWNLVKAHNEGFDHLITPCSACLYHFKYAIKQVADHPELRPELEEVIETPINSIPRVIHPLELLTSNRYEKQIRDRIQRNLSDLKVVCYYGCHISRPAEIMQFDDPENPQSMDRLMQWVGVQTLDWSSKLMCCGAHFSMIKPKVVVDLCTNIFDLALQAGAEAIVVACPMCHANLDTRQDQIESRLNTQLNVPILYFSQIIGFALGLEPAHLGLKKHIVDPLPLMMEKCQPGF